MLGEDYLLLNMLEVVLLLRLCDLTLLLYLEEELVWFPQLDRRKLSKTPRQVGKATIRTVGY